MIPATCPCCESAGPSHSLGCTFRKDFPDECMDFDDMARLRAEVARLRLTDAERKALVTAREWCLASACNNIGEEVRREINNLLARLGGAR